MKSFKEALEIIQETPVDIEKSKADPTKIKVLVKQREGDPRIANVDDIMTVASFKEYLKTNKKFGLGNIDEIVGINPNTKLSAIAKDNTVEFEVRNLQLIYKK